MKTNREEENLNILIDKYNSSNNRYNNKNINNHQQQSGRNYGIDLLKIIAMINIINLHIK